MGIAVILSLMLAVIAAVARYKMSKNLEGMKVELVELETEHRRVGGQRRQVEDELQRVELRERELTIDLQGMANRLQAAQEQTKQVKTISQKRIEREKIDED
jgi:septal ring factor EnvC (AmiA/AmiB activator)